MINFKILKQSNKSRARLGLLETPHGTVETPAFVPVATQATLKTLDRDEALETGSQLLIVNTLHMHLRPGGEVVKKQGGLHKLMQWPRPLMTDSGGFQVFSLGFGRDFGLGKILSEARAKDLSAQADAQAKIKLDTRPKNLKISEAGVYFRSWIDGRELFLGPKESIKIQEQLGADIIFAFDECTPPLASEAYIAKSLELTHRWAKECLKVKKSNQALYGIVQGSQFKHLREQSAKFISGLDFDGFGIGGDLGETKQGTKRVLDWVMPHLPASKPRHLLGIGHPEDMELIIKGGVDTFDCIAPTHYARHGVAFTTTGRLNLRQAKFLTSTLPLDKKCQCMVCGTYTRAYIAHLVRSKEITGLKLLTYHNVWYFNSLAAVLRQQIKDGKI
jgi:queuine tRNA-ribosyltransferase/7-cyano-7-deazaguanine tRNA-ribosyltransferase